MKQFILDCCHDPIALTAMIITALLVIYDWINYLKNEKYEPNYKIIGYVNALSIIAIYIFTNLNLIYIAIFLICWLVIWSVFIPIVLTIIYRIIYQCYEVVKFIIQTQK